MNCSINCISEVCYIRNSSKYSLSRRINPIQKFQACDKGMTTLWPGCSYQVVTSCPQPWNNFGFETVATLWQPCNNLAATLLHKSSNSKAWCSVGTLYKCAGIIKYSPLPLSQWMSGHMYCSYVDVHMINVISSVLCVKHNSVSLYRAQLKNQLWGTASVYEYCYLWH